jgi:hypothetical protein
MDQENIRVAWPPHSYENIYDIQERYESVKMARHMGAQTRAIPPLRHKDEFAYECTRPCRVQRATSTHKRSPWVVGVVREPSSLSRPLAAAIEHHSPPTRARSGSAGGHAPADR